MRIILSTVLMALCLVGSAFSYEGDAYVTPDSWSKHITANGVKASTKGIDIGNGILKLGLTTRGQFRIYDNSDTNLYQYVRARLSEVELGNGTLSLNLNIRGAWHIANRSSNIREYHAFYDPLDIERDKSGDVSLRVYQANVELKEVLKYTDISLGRIYLTSFDGYKIDGGNIKVTPFDFLSVNVYYGLPVSYYTNLNTQVVGGSIDAPIEQSGTRVRAEYSYFMHKDGGDLNTNVARARIDQNLNLKDILGANIYAEGAMIGKAWTYDVGADINVNYTKTGISGYVMGQYDKNKEEINPYVGLYESVLGAESEYFMGGFLISQGITDYVMLGVGFEGRYNFSESYGDRDYYRVFGTVDLVGLIHRNNFLSIVADYYTLASYKRLDQNSKLLVGARMTQRFTDSIEVWLGTNVMNYQYKNNPIKYYPGESGYTTIDFDTKKNENTTLAYIGGMWQPADWCAIQLDYTFEYNDIFGTYDIKKDAHVISAWVNFLW